MRNGFTLVETIVALVILQFAVLALGAALGVAARDLAFARQSMAAHTLARNGVALSRASPCAVPGSHATQTGVFLERRTVVGVGRQRTIIDSVFFPRAGNRQGVAVARADIWCRL
jgi:Tfp pilus assembly protein PilV